MVEIIIPKAQTLTRTAIFFGDLESAVKKFRPDFREIKVGLGNTIKYGLYDEKTPYILIISKQIHEMLANNEYNTIFTVTSDYAATNSRIAMEFAASSGINLVQPSRPMPTDSRYMNMAFEVIKRRGMPLFDILVQG